MPLVFLIQLGYNGADDRPKSKKIFYHFRLFSTFCFFLILLLLSWNEKNSYSDKFRVIFEAATKMSDWKSKKSAVLPQNDRKLRPLIMHDISSLSLVEIYGRKNKET